MLSLDVEVGLDHTAKENRSYFIWVLVHRLGGIPLERIRLHPPPGTATEQDVIHQDK
jgi:hypothetical protein